MNLRQHSIQAENAVRASVASAAPESATVDPGAVEGADASSGSWVMSSFDLMHGVEITDSPDVISDDLFNALFVAQ